MSVELDVGRLGQVRQPVEEFLGTGVRNLREVKGQFTNKSIYIFSQTITIRKIEAPLKMKPLIIVQSFLFLLLSFAFSSFSAIEAYFSGSIAGLGSLIILLLNWLASFEILSSPNGSTGEKLLWIGLILFFPLFGLAMYG